MQDTQGSKTSLITKEGETPRKKGGKKKKKVKKVGAVDEFGDSAWADDLRTMEDDIITGDQKADDDDEEDDELGESKPTARSGKKKLPTFVTPPVLMSQPLDKIFVETNSESIRAKVL